MPNSTFRQSGKYTVQKKNKKSEANESGTTDSSCSSNCSDSSNVFGDEFSDESGGNNMEAPGPNLDQTSSSSSENVVSDNNSDCGAVNLIPKGRNGPLDDKIAEFAVENKHSLHLLSITR